METIQIFEFDPNNKEALKVIMTNLLNGTFSMFKKNHPKATVEELEAALNRKYSIGQGVIMVPTDEFKDIKEMKGYNDICFLFKDGVKLTEIPFRQGGLFSGFKENREYCNIIAYPELVQRKYSFGNHVIINTKGEIVLRANAYDHPYYHRGVIASIKQTYYNLLTGKPIVYGDKNVSCDKFLFVENNYKIGEGSKYDLGVYKIDYATGEFEIFQ